jgi:LacI family transcriptional regulator
MSTMDSASTASLALRTGRAATLQEVADTAGVHRSTASRALNPETAWRISSEVVARVIETAERLGYRRDLAAASLRNGQTRLVGVLVPDLGNPVFAPILARLEVALAEHGYAVLIANAPETAEGGLKLLDNLLARRAEGIVLATTREGDPLLAHCLEQRVPVVLVNRTDLSEQVSSAGPDDKAGMALVIRHLAEQGHKRIAHLAGPQNTSTGRLRADGFHSALQAAGLASHGMVAATAYSREAGQAATRELLTMFPGITAIAAANDLLALGAYQVIAEKGLNCPGDISVTGHNDMPLVDMTHPPLTTVRISPDEIGREAARLILRKINSPAAAAQQVRTAPTLVVRGSTQPPLP